MPNGKRKSKARTRREPVPPFCAQWLIREVLPFVRLPRLPRTRSTRHLRNATIEALEAFRAVLDEVIDWLRREGRSPAELKRIRVEG